MHFLKKHSKSGQSFSPTPIFKFISFAPSWHGHVVYTYSINPASLLVYLQLHLLHHCQGILPKISNHSAYVTSKILL